MSEKESSNLFELYETKITINDAVVTTGLGASFIGAGIYESIEDLYAICTIQFEGSEDFIEKAAIVDGSPIAIYIKSKQLGFNFVYYFRVSEIVVAQGTNNSLQYTVYGYTDFYKLFESPIKFSHKGKSSDVFRNVAKEYDLEAEIDDTNDNQLWVCSEQNLKEWLSFICSKGWVNQTSGMFWCIDRHRCLLYKNIDDLFKKKTKYTFIPSTNGGTISSNTVSYISVANATKTGKENLTFNGYGGSDYNFNLLNYNLNESKAQYVTAQSNIMNINKELSQGLKRSFYPIDVGNFHENYFLAHDQNMRVLSTFSTYYEFVCQFFQPVRLGQLIEIDKNSLTNGNVSKTLNMKAMINNIQINISESIVSMKVKACSQGFNGTSTTTY